MLISGRTMQVAPARLTDDVAVLAHQLTAQERRLHTRRELDAFERCVALRRLGILRANGPAFLRVDQHEVRVLAYGDVALQVEPEALRRIAAGQLGDTVGRKAALRALGDERRQQVLGTAEPRFREPDVPERVLRRLGLVAAA